MRDSTDGSSQERLKEGVAAFWEVASCGEVYAGGTSEAERLEAQGNARYSLEPYIFDFARFPSAKGLDVLEVGVGMGADHCEWAKAAPRSLTGLDLTLRAARHTRRRLSLLGLASRVQVGDAENLPFADDSFDIVYSWGVLHHTPNTVRAIQEVHRVLRPSGRALVMIYHRQSIVGYLLWLRYALAIGRPWQTLDAMYAEHLESPGTKAYSVDEARALFASFSKVATSVQLSCGDTLEGEAGQRHKGRLLRLARKIWPRRLIRSHLGSRGLFLLIEAVK